MRLHVCLIVSLICVSQGYVNERLQSLFAALQQRRFVPGAGGARGAPGDPYAYLRAAPAPDAAADPPSPGDAGFPFNSIHEANLTGVESLDWLHQGARRGQDSDELWNLYSPPLNPTLDNTYFCAIQNIEPIYAEVTNELEFPWLARVYHVPVESDRVAPLICTAVLVAEMTFLTAARCIATAKASFTTVHYKQWRLPVKAFLWPANSSKQMFDDVGVILTWASTGPPPTWQPVLLRNSTRRTDDHFRWFKDWNLERPVNTVVGFYQPEGSLSKPVMYKMTGVYAGNTLCNRILPRRRRSDDYWIPCAHTCLPSQQMRGDAQCERRLIGLGHALVDSDKRLIGVVTWHCLADERYATPLGIAVINRDDYWSHTECLRRLAADTVPPNKLTKGYYSKKCGETSSIKDW